MSHVVVDRWYNFAPYSIATGEWVRLATPQSHCEGWGLPRRHHGNRTSRYNCNGGTGTWASTRARWIRWDGTLQCGTCHKLDVQATTPTETKETQ